MPIHALLNLQTNLPVYLYDKSLPPFMQCLPFFVVRALSCPSWALQGPRLSQHVEKLTINWSVDSWGAGQATTNNEITLKRPGHSNSRMFPKNNYDILGISSRDCWIPTLRCCLYKSQSTAKLFQSGSLSAPRSGFVRGSTSNDRATG